MTIQRIIQCVGLGEEDMAHLRLLMRMARKELRDEWVWGTEARADLVIVNPRRLMGESALRRAMQREVTCAQVIEPGDTKPAGLFLRKPLRRDAVVTLFNRVGQHHDKGPEVDAWSDEHFDFDLGDVDLSVLEAAYPGVQGQARAPRLERPEVEMLTESPGLPEARRSERDDENDAGASASAGSGGDDRRDAGPVVGSVYEPEIAETAEEAPEPIDPDATFPLIYYLQRGVLLGPSIIATLRGAPSLLVDPEGEMFWAQGSLQLLEPYAKQLLRYGDWRRLSARGEMEQARRGTAARPYARLIWMDKFVHSNGFLAKHFDPGGTFRLTNRLDLSLDYPRAFRVGSHMTTHRKLHEIARVSSVGLAEVFDVVNAYEAIGYVEAQPSERQRDARK